MLLLLISHVSLFLIFNKSEIEFLIPSEILIIFIFFNDDEFNLSFLHMLLQFSIYKCIHSFPLFTFHDSYFLMTLNSFIFINPSCCYFVESLSDLFVASF